MRVPYFSFSPRKVSFYYLYEGPRKKRAKNPYAGACNNSSAQASIIILYPETKQNIDEWLTSGTTLDFQDFCKQRYEAENTRLETAIANSEANLKENKVKGKLSQSAKRRLQDALAWFQLLAKEKEVPHEGGKIKFRTNFFTLTLSAKQMHTDKFIKSEMLDPLLKRLRDGHGMKAYLWRAEAQENGNIHFHILTNVYCHHKELRHYWNKIQATHGYIKAYSEANSGKTDPNSTDVHATYKVRNLGGYLTKYMAKESPGQREIDGRQWFLSQSLSKIKPIIRQGEVSDYAPSLKAANIELIDYDYVQMAFTNLWANPHVPKIPELNDIVQQAFKDYSSYVN